MSEVQFVAIINEDKDVAAPFMRCGCCGRGIMINEDDPVPATCKWCGKKVVWLKECYICKEKFIENNEYEAKRIKDDEYDSCLQTISRLRFPDGTVKSICYKCGNILSVVNDLRY